ncbi:hypothetical protein Dimus_010237, partial [Dionaea muscipula]
MLLDGAGAASRSLLLLAVASAAGRISQLAAAGAAYRLPRPYPPCVDHLAWFLAWLSAFVFGKHVIDRGCASMHGARAWPCTDAL